jgi:hypothetical protein
VIIRGLTICKSFVEYYIEKGNTDELFKIIWPTKKKKGKTIKIFEDQGDFILFVS